MTLTPPFAEIEAQDVTTLAGRFPALVQREVVVNMDGPAPSYFDKMRDGLARRGRRGEAVLILRRPDGRLWLHSKSHYPAGLYRLMTGGIVKEEPALDAARRECWEEAGLTAEIADCLGIVRYRLERAGESLPFISYFFVLDVNDAAPASQDPHERICAYRAVAPAELPAIAAALRHVPPAWRDWGRFRAIGHDFVAERLAHQ